ncbi:MAG: hypothetical protein AUG51_03420 [Acidobacteria bacterium 13_1_20CM_3_53_8]|nr:MAG: hypothetical protein AUG51_03420 [Acidobacteria bacterium 13_1_20CM_3_53_8]
MTKFTSRIFLTLTVLFLFSATALAQSTHSVWSIKPLAVTDGQTGAHYSAFSSGNMATAWTETTKDAYFRAVAVINPNLKYDFRLVNTTANTTADMIEGLYDIRRNGVMVCHLCVGRAYRLSLPVGNYFKLYVGTPAAYAERWHYSGYITSRFDF